jgi:flagellar biosynthesis component FlhA
MFRKTKELQNLVNASRKNLKNAERKIEDRNILIADLQSKNEELTNENLAVHEENKDLRFENDEQEELIDRIKRIATSNAYNNEKAILRKIKELISDAENQN